MMSEMPQSGDSLGRVKTYEDGMGYGDRNREPDPAVMSAGYHVQPAPASFDDYHLFLDDFASSGTLPRRGVSESQFILAFDTEALTNRSSASP